MRSYIYIILFFVGAFLSSCAFDNYDEPSSQFTGNITYQGEPLGLSVGEVTFQLYEPGWQLKSPILVNVAHDGSFSALIFNGNYKMIIPKNQGPFMNISAAGSDTIEIKLSGNTQKDIEVMPYYMVRNPQFSVSGRKVTATFKAEKIITDANAKSIERVNLYVNKTMLVDGRADYNINDPGQKSKWEKNGADITDPNVITLSLDVPEITPTQNYVFARVGIKMAGVEKMIFSPVQKINL